MPETAKKEHRNNVPAISTDQKEQEEQKDEHTPHNAHFVRTGVSLNPKELEDSKGEGYEKKICLIERLMKVRKNSYFMELVSNLPSSTDEEKKTFRDKSVDRMEKVGIGTDIGETLANGANSVFDIASEAVKKELVKSKVSDIIAFVTDMEGTARKAYDFIQDLVAGKQELSFDYIMGLLNKTSTAGNAVAKALKFAGKGIPVLGWLFTFLCDGLELVRNIGNQISIYRHRKDIRRKVEKYGFLLDSKEATDRDVRRDATVNWNAQGQYIKNAKKETEDDTQDDTWTDEDTKLSWTAAKQRRDELTNINATGELTKEDEKAELTNLVRRDRTMRALISFEMLRKQNVSWRDGFKQLAQTTMDFIADFTTFFNPAVGAIFGGVSLAVGTASSAVSFFRKHLINHDKKNRSRQIYASYLYDHMDKGGEFIQNKQLVYQLPEHHEDAWQAVEDLDKHLTSIKDKSEYYQFADDISYTEWILRKNNMDFKKALRQKTKTGLLDVMADSFGQ